jgi:hypothetical protein
MTTRSQLDHETLIALIERLESLGYLSAADRDALIGGGRRDLERAKESKRNFREGRGPPKWAGSGGQP